MTTTEIIKLAEEFGADLSDSALLPDGSGGWDDWRNHVTSKVVHHWRELPLLTRAVAFLQARSVTAYQERPETAGADECET